MFVKFVIGAWNLHYQKVKEMHIRHFVVGKKRAGRP